MAIAYQKERAVASYSLHMNMSDTGRSLFYEFEFPLHKQLLHKGIIDTPFQTR